MTFNIYIYIYIYILVREEHLWKKAKNVPYYRKFMPNEFSAIDKNLLYFNLH